MTELRELLDLRERRKAKKPNFIRQDAHKKSRLEVKWRKPKGLHSKMWLRRSGRLTRVSVGFGSPNKVRYLHKSGLRCVVVHSANELKRINKEKDGVIIAKTVGLRKRVEILKQIKGMGISLLNIKDINAYLKEAEDGMKQRKEKRKEAIKEKEGRKKKEEKTAEEKNKKEGLAEKIQTEEEKKLPEEGLEKAKLSQKEAEKKEIDKALTKKQK